VRVCYISCPINTMYKAVFPLLLILSACNSATSTKELFTPVNASFDNRTVVVPSGFKYQTLFAEGDTVVSINGVKAPAKGSQDLIVYIPIKN